MCCGHELFPALPARRERRAATRTMALLDGDQTAAENPLLRRRRRDLPLEQPLASVLVIDDEEVIRSLLVESLSSDGFEVESAVSGEQALEMVRRRRFDLAVTDLKMPGMDGIATMRALKQADRELQVVVMTGYASLDTAIDALKGGAFDYIQKPFKPSEMTSLLKKAMEGLIATLKRDIPRLLAGENFQQRKKVHLQQAQRRELCDDVALPDQFRRLLGQFTLLDNPGG